MVRGIVDRAERSETSVRAMNARQKCFAIQDDVAIVFEEDGGILLHRESGSHLEPL
jgi:hypothetical protein